MHFFSDESGAVTVDWVVLTAALVGLGLATMAVVSSGVEDVSGDVKSQLAANDIIVTSFPSASDVDISALSTYGWVSQEEMVAEYAAIWALDDATLQAEAQPWLDGNILDVEVRYHQELYQFELDRRAE